MGILDELLGGGQLQKEYKDFVDRYEQGDPSAGYSDQEVLKRYGEVSHAVPPDQYAQAAQEALGKLSPEERAAFVKMLQERAAERGVTLPREVASDPKDLGQVLTDLHEKPGQLREILSGILSSGRPFDLPFMVEQWDDTDSQVEDLIALTGDYRVARAAFEEAVKRRPGRIVTLRQKT